MTKPEITSLFLSFSVSGTMSITLPQFLASAGRVGKFISLLFKDSSNSFVWNKPYWWGAKLLFIKKGVGNTRRLAETEGPIVSCCSFHYCFIAAIPQTLL